MPLEPGSLLPALALTPFYGDPLAPDSDLALWCVFKTECPTCALAFPFWQRLTDLVPELPVVAMAQNSASEVKDFLADLGCTPSGLRLMLEPEPYRASRALGVLYTPTAFLVENGRITQVIEAWQRGEYNRLATEMTRRFQRTSPVLARDDEVPAFQYG